MFEKYIQTEIMKVFKDNLKFVVLNIQQGQNKIKFRLVNDMVLGLQL